MDKYFDHLLEDIRLSYTNLTINASLKVYPTSMYPNDLPEHVQHLPYYRMKPISEWMKLDPEAFPPANRWEDRHLKILCSGLRQLFTEYQYEHVLPWTLELDKEYTWLVQALSIAEVCFAGEEDNGTIPLYFCKQDPDNCPFSDDCLHRANIGCESRDVAQGWGKYL